VLVCAICGGELCGTCDGCLECGDGRDPECPECGDVGEWVAIELDIEEADTPLADPILLFSVGSTPIYLFAPAGTPYWAILSLLLTVAGVAVVTVTFIKAVRQKKDENLEVDEHVAMLHNLDSYDNDYVTNIAEGKERYNKRRRLWALTMMYALSIGAVLLLIIVQDFRGVIVIFDWWAIIHAILFAGVILCRFLTFRTYEDYPGHSMPAVSSP
jgi:hypothetical protein